VAGEVKLIGTRTVQDKKFQKYERRRKENTSFFGKEAF